MVEIRVAVGNAMGVQGLVGRLTGMFDRSSVSFDGARQEVQVRSSESGIFGVFDVVEAWLAEDGFESAKLWVGEHSYTMVRAAPIGRDL